MGEDFSMTFRPAPVLGLLVVATAGVLPATIPSNWWNRDPIAT